jgi:hypothetical protein
MKSEMGFLNKPNIGGIYDICKFLAIVASAKLGKS